MMANYSHHHHQSPASGGSAEMVEAQSRIRHLEGELERALKQGWAEIERLQAENDDKINQVRSLHGTIDHLRMENDVKARQIQSLEEIVDQLRRQQQQQQQQQENEDSGTIETASSNIQNTNDSNNNNNNAKTRNEKPATAGRDDDGISALTDAPSLVVDFPTAFGNPASSPSNNNNKSPRPGMQRRQSWGSKIFNKSKQHEEDRMAKEEEGWMHQMDVLQKAKNAEIDELHLKLIQRDSAIQTLERTILLREQVVSDLRDELADLKAKLLERRVSLEKDQLPLMVEAITVSRDGGRGSGGDAAGLHDSGTSFPSIDLTGNSDSPRNNYRGRQRRSSSRDRVSLFRHASVSAINNSSTSPFPSIDLGRNNDDDTNDRHRRSNSHDLVGLFPTTTTTATDGTVASSTTGLEELTIRKTRSSSSRPRTSRRRRKSLHL